MWRPKKWETPWRFERVPSLSELVRAQDTDAVKFYQNEAFEAGADAMLEALREDGSSQLLLATAKDRRWYDSYTRRYVERRETIERPGKKAKLRRGNG